MKTAIILHGRPDKKQFDDPSFPSTSNYFWLPWAQKQLAINGIPTETPEVPNAWRPHYPTWKVTFERYEIGPQTMLIGHSCGAGFLVRWLSEQKNVKVGKVVLVAPWIDPAGDPGNTDTVDFFDFTIDPHMASRTKGLSIIHSDDDMKTIQVSVKKLLKDVKDIKYIELHAQGHFYDKSKMEFPELLKELL